MTALIKQHSNILTLFKGGKWEQNNATISVAILKKDPDISKTVHTLADVTWPWDSPSSPQLSWNEPSRFGAEESKLSVLHGMFDRQGMCVTVCVCALTGQKYVFSVMCWATRGSEADRDMMSSRASLACWPTEPCLKGRERERERDLRLCLLCSHVCTPECTYMFMYRVQSKVFCCAETKHCSATCKQKLS